ncbi:cell cycle control protein 50C-like [Sorex araneus]|uniref:cell cycle control protein 50C-like n=1 Tax=Sorex araneus TaxID=42254 RepID=UPI0024335879|nr:cell cycle control protein 50C-like [Sorex araneus]
MKITQSKLPDNTAFKQQQLPAVRIQYSPKRVLFSFYAIGIFCTSMGIILILSAKSITEIEVNYTKICANCATLRENAHNFEEECHCSIPFTLPKAMKGNVYMYYKLYGFYQNLHPYIQSRSNKQLLGVDLKNVDDCYPFYSYDNGVPIAPCGVIANSMFNDTIILSYNRNSSTHIQVPMLRNGITWWTDKYVKFQNPVSSDLSVAFEGTAKPPNWRKPVYELDEEKPENNGFLNEDFIVWMRTAAFPTFKKLYRLLNRTGYFVEGLPPGNYSFTINYNFPVTMFHGKKAIVLTNLTWSGGKSFFLGIVYTMTGTITCLSTITMTVIHSRIRKNESVTAPAVKSTEELTENKNGH